MQEQTISNAKEFRAEAANATHKQSSDKYPEYADRCSPKEWASHVLEDLVAKKATGN